MGLAAGQRVDPRLPRPQDAGAPRSKMRRSSPVALRILRKRAGPNRCARWRSPRRSSPRSARAVHRPRLQRRRSQARCRQVRDPDVGLWNSRFSADRAIVGRDVATQRRTVSRGRRAAAGFRAPVARRLGPVPFAFTPQQMSDAGAATSSAR
jgi:hypothetical protein